MIKKEYKNDFGDHIIFEFPEELIDTYEQWVYLNTNEPDRYGEWCALDDELAPYKTDLNS